ncbi:MAG: Mu transposase C-terminal domain-containing protein [Solidesulfovibrio sp.]|uniref:Mu transposase C-terminal domain-containing protein n=1 Tax=Solidesulfovibrio sp. TaxID=2910990 RepID=UPI003157F89E
MREAITANYIATALSVSVQAVLKRSNKESWPFNEEKGRGRGGKRRLYPLSTLPADIRAALAEAPLVTEPAADIIREEPEPLPPVKAETLANWQRSCRDARLRILREIERMKRLEGIEKAMRHFIALAETGELCDSLAQAVEMANARKREGKALCTFTIRNWMKALAKGGPDALAPRGNPPKPMPVWLPDFLKLYRQPQKPDVSWCYEKMTGAGVALPSLRTVQREIKRLGVVEANRGRMGRRELKSLLAYSRRDFSMLLPTDIYTGDGHTADLEVQHPSHGRPLRPEIVSVLDVATRKCVGWSVGLAESSWLVADAIRCGVERCGIPAIFYADRGPGFRNDLLNGPGVGILDRIGASPESSIPYNSQARGVIEGFQKFWIRESKASPAYVGKDMDREARKSMFDKTRAEVKEFGHAKSLAPWDKFVAWVEKLVEGYNNRPHSSLPEIRDPANGKMRHMTPNEQWVALAPEADIIMEEEAVLEDLFRPYEVKRVNRCVVKVLGNEYSNKALTLYHEQEVIAGYDIHDPTTVWIRDLNERFLCTATLNAHVTPYFPKSVVEKAREKRAKSRLERLERREEEVLAELNGGQQVLDVAPMTDAELLIHQQIVKEFEEAPRAKPAVPETQRERFHMAKQLEKRQEGGAHPLTPEEAAWLHSFQGTAEYQAEADLYEGFGDEMFG